jgi:hypothetical protein
MSIDVEQLTQQLASPAGQLAFLGCTIVTAPPGHHEALMRALQPLVDAELIGPTIVLDGENQQEASDRYMRRAVDLLLSEPSTGDV